MAVDPSSPPHNIVLFWLSAWIMGGILTFPSSSDWKKRRISAHGETRLNKVRKVAMV